MTSQKRPRPRPGVYDSPFWSYIEQNELRLQGCLSCSHLRYPPAAVCPRCLSDSFEWRKVSGRGQIVSWATFHRKYLDLPVPYTVVSVALEEGPLLIGNINPGDKKLRLNLPVTVKFEETQDEDGKAWTIFQWELAGN